MLEQPALYWGGPVVASYILYTICGLPFFWAFLMAIGYPFCLVSILISVTFLSQFYGEAGLVDPAIKKIQDENIEWKDKEFKNKWYGQKIPFETAFEAFQDDKIVFRKASNKKEMAVYEVLLCRHELFKMSITHENVISILKDLLYRVWKHNADADKADVSDVYNRGNDWYGWFLCDKMLYSVGLWESSDPKQCSPEKGKNEEMNKIMSTAQTKKLDKICSELTMMKPNMEHLDLGCGWGALILHASGKYKVNSQGVTLSQEQANHIASLDTEKRTKVHVINAWNFLADCKAAGKKFDVITCLEMSEHIGVRDYQTFCHAVRDILKDDGIFYLQIAGLRRAWQYEDLIWGLFMNKYIFPGADASCPLYWDVEQLERAGFEIRSIENMGVHYALTIYAWYNNWLKNKAEVVAKYGEKNWRNWSIFLAWSYIIANQGSSTVWMINMSKQFPYDAMTRAASSKNAIEEFGINRAQLWIDRKR